MYKYSSIKPFITKIIDRKLISKKPSVKKVYIISLDIKGSDFEFQPGDSIGIIPQNDPGIVDLTIKYMKASPNDLIKHPKKDLEMTLRVFLTTEVNISKVSPAIVKMLDEKLDPKKIKELTQSHHLWDLLQKYPKHKLSFQQIANKLLPMLPRLYSVASAMSMYPDRINLLIAHVSYELSGINRNGVCTEFVCHLSKENVTDIKIYSRPAPNFKLTDKNTPIIMIGPGVGLAPFISFLEEKVKTKASNKNWLFFGDRSSRDNFYYEEFLKDLEKKNFLKLSLAFSRDQEKKVYVQDRLFENSKEVFEWIQNGAVIYICGDAKYMARDVEKKFLDIFVKEGKMNTDGAQKYLDTLRDEKRYLKDVY